MMRSALYYPNTEIKTESLLKTALLLWDRVHIIVPWEGYRPDYRSIDLSQAFELIGYCHYPSEEEKRQAHEIIEDFAKQPLPEAFTYREAEWTGAEPYELYPQKLLPKTWEMLRN